MSAVRNLGGQELNGRPLRIDSATNAPGGGGGGGGGGSEMGRATAGRHVGNVEVCDFGLVHVHYCMRGLVWGEGLHYTVQISCTFCDLTLARAKLPGW